MYIKFLLFACILAFAYSEKLKVSIFYESHCTCSSLLIKKNFYPAYRNLKDYIDVEFVPYGNTRRHLQNGDWYFCCKGRQDELGCHANRIHACAISANYTQDQTVDFVECIVDGLYTRRELEKCINSTEIDLEEVMSCANSTASNLLLSKFGDRTEAFKLSDIPAIIYDDVYNQTLDEHARKNFLKTTCDLFRGEKAPICNFFDNQV